MQKKSLYIPCKPLHNVADWEIEAYSRINYMCSFLIQFCLGKASFIFPTKSPTLYIATLTWKFASASLFKCQHYHNNIYPMVHNDYKN